MKKKNQKGITLIALIITIIVMMILVAVSVTVALQSGLFRATSKAARDTREKAEKIAQDKYAEFLNYYMETGDYNEAAKLIGAKHI